VEDFAAAHARVHSGGELKQSLLDAMQWRADPLADETVAQLLGPWQSANPSQHEAALFAANADHWLRIRIANKLIAQWTNNASLLDWKAKDEGTHSPHFAQVAVALERYVEQARALPAWADLEKIDRAETIFVEHGVLSCLLLFCASLPECYVLPDLSDVLHVAGQLEQHTEHRIRATAAMIFPVMMRGGLTSPQGAGVAQVLKVRLIHAMIRNLILRGDPQSAAQLVLASDDLSVGLVEKLDVPIGSVDMYQTLFAHGWDLRRDQLPCNQEELAYTLLTFHYVFLRGMRTLGVPLPEKDETAYLHAWNVMAHVLGVENVLMSASMTQAKTRFDEMQVRGRADAEKRPVASDPRPKLGRALMASMEDVIPIRALKGFPSLLTKKLCGATVARELGIEGRASFASRALFAILMGVVRIIDTIVRWFVPQFSISRMFGRILGYHLMCKFLMDQTRPLKLPSELLANMQTMFGNWSEDPAQPKWLNRLEDRFTVRGSWHDSPKHKT
jgi:ER-bound oxygenase mpaB/B'/Rubber oxygenase, catalytic domain